MKKLFHHMKGVFERSYRESQRSSCCDDICNDSEARYYQFRQLLFAHTQAMELMANMEAALFGEIRWGANFTRVNTARLCAQVYAMIRHLRVLAPGKYSKIYDKFQEIHDLLQESLPQVANYTVDKDVEGEQLFGLRGVAELILPLSLLNPESLDFRASKCQTLHDIIRFCHESGVREVCSFGDDQTPCRYKAKQLHVNSCAKQFWVIDLQGGVLEDRVVLGSKNTDHKGKWLNIRHVASEPMLSLWHGIHAFSWQGPPAVNGKGLLSIMFEASKNPQLNIATKSTYAFKNYFMISKEYCSFEARFGFHFISAEAVAGEFPVENYVSFRFFGGAADSERKRKRLAFIGKLLEEYDFRCTVWQDALSARIEGRKKEFILRRLMVLGYVIMHTRQLDMIMDDSAQVAAYRKKMLTEIEEMLRGKTV
ncbi:MAG: hypothetical protein ACNI27_14800 [Desulfovibrio sp.]